MAGENLLLTTLWRIWHFPGASERELDVVVPVVLRAVALISAPVILFALWSANAALQPIALMAIPLVIVLWGLAKYYQRVGLRLSLIGLALVFGLDGLLVLERYHGLFAVYPSLLFVAQIALLIRGFRFALAFSLLLLSGYGLFMTYVIPQEVLGDLRMIPVMMVAGLVLSLLLLAAVYTALVHVRSTLTATNERLALKLQTFQDLVNAQRAAHAAKEGSPVPVTSASNAELQNQEPGILHRDNGEVDLDAMLEAGLELIEWNSLFDRIQRAVERGVSAEALQLHFADNVEKNELFLMDASRLSGIVAQLAIDAAECGTSPQLSARVEPLPDADNANRFRLGITVSGRDLSAGCEALIFGRFDEQPNDGSPSSINLLIAGRWIDELDADLKLIRAGDLSYTLMLEFEAPSFAPETVSMPTQAAAIEARLPTIMIVDDDSSVRASIKSLVLQEFGVKVIVCGSGREALEQLQQQSVDLIITDYYMPGMDGAEMIRQLREEQMHTPVLAITTAGMGDAQDELWLAGADVVLPKPFTSKSLTHLVYRYIYSQ